MPDNQESHWTIEPFDRSRHDRSDFDCGVPWLNEWFATKAGQFEKRDLARVYVLVAAGTPTVRGYYAISSHSVAFEALSQTQAQGLPRMDLPVLLIGKLAVDNSVQGRHLGEYLLLDALRRAEYLAKKVGILAVEVHAMNDAARRFYEKYGLLSLADDPQHLFLPMHVVRKLKLPPF